MAKRRSEKKRPQVPQGLALVAVVTALLLLQPLAYAMLIGTTPISTTKNWDDAAQWIKDNTPATSGTYSAGMGTKPEYGVMTWWDNGNFILYRGERPAVANNFQTGVGDAASFFIAQNESAASAIIDRDQARYVVVDYLMGSASIGIPGIFDNMPKLAGDDPLTYFMSYEWLDPSVNEIKQYVDGNDKYYGTMFSRLYNGHGMGGKDPLGNMTSGLEQYRMVYENNGTDPAIVFEKVAGATITGNATPGSKVELRLNVSDPMNTLTYYSVTRADQSGAFSFTVPYATDAASGYVKTGPRYTITSGSAVMEASVPEDAVTGGKIISAGDL